MKPPKTTEVSPSRPSLSFPLILVLSLFLVACYYDQWITMEKLSEAIGPLSRIGTVAALLGFLREYGSRIFTSADAWMFHLTWVIPCLLLFLEWRRRTLTKFSEALPRSTGHFILYIALLGLVCLRFYFARGEDAYNGDSSYFFFLARLMRDNFAHFIVWPFYTFIHGGGGIFNAAYGPLHSYLTGFISLFTGGIYPASKIVLFLFHLASAIGVFLFITELTGSRRAGFFAAVAALLSYFHSHIALYPGRYGEASIWAVYPFLFYFLERLIKRTSFRDTILLGLCVGLTILGSLGLSYYFLLFFGVYTLVRGLTAAEGFSKKILVLVIAAAAAVIGLTIASYYLYGFLFESKWNLTYTLLGGTARHATVESGILAPLFLWNTYRVSLFNLQIPWQTAYLGLSLVALALAALVLGVRQRWKAVLAPAALFLLALFLFLAYGRLKFLDAIPFLQTYTQARLINLVAFTTILLAGLGAEALLRQFPSKPRLFWILMALVFIDLFPATFQDTFGKKYGDYAEPFFKQLETSYDSRAGKIAPFRTDMLGSGQSRAIQDNWRNYNAMIAHTGQSLTFQSGSDYLPLIRFVDYFHRSLYAGAPWITRDVFRKFYYLLDTRFILSTLDLPADLFASSRRNGPVSLVELPAWTPVLFTTRLQKSDFSTNMIPAFLTGTKIDFGRNTIDAMPVTTGASASIDGPVPDCRVTLNEPTVRHALLTIEASGPVFAVLSYAAFPVVKVLVNGVESPWQETACGNIALRLGAGTSRIEIKACRTRNASIVFYLSCLLFLGIFVYLVVSELLRRRQGPIR